MSQIVSRPNSTEVRLWAVANGLASQSRGRLSSHAISEFNKAHGLFGARAYVRDVPVRTHSVKPAKGRTITRNYVVSECRAWAVENGYYAPGTRGKLSEAVKDAYVLSLVSL